MRACFLFQCFWVWLVATVGAPPCKRKWDLDVDERVVLLGSKANQITLIFFARSRSGKKLKLKAPRSAHKPNHCSAYHPPTSQHSDQAPLL